MTISNAESEFERLILEVQACSVCPRMRNSSRILGRSAGSLSAKIMFIGEAPGRLGADETHVPFHGDRAGENFERLLAQAHLDRYQIFVTNAVLCNPKDAHGNNAPPSKLEIGSCSNFLKRQIELVDPEIVVALGGTALQALSLVEHHDLSLAAHVRTSARWFGRQLIPLYHPGQRALLHRSFANQLSDYQFVSEQAKRTEKRRRIVSGVVGRGAVAVVDEIFSNTPRLSYFALHKLFFLVEYTYFVSHAARLTGSYIIRQKDGPYCVDLHWRKLLNSPLQLRVMTEKGKMYLAREAELGLAGSQNPLNEEARRTIHDVIATYGAMDDAQLKTAVYLTKAMRSMLRRERKEGLNLFNAPIPFDGPEAGSRFESGSVASH